MAASVEYVLFFLLLSFMPKSMIILHFEKNKYAYATRKQEQHDGLMIDTSNWKESLTHWGRGKGAAISQTF